MKNAFFLDKPIIKICILCILSLFIAFICFYFLNSKAKIQNKWYSAGGGLSGFVITFVVLNYQLILLEKKSKDTTTELIEKKVKIQDTDFSI